MSNDIKDRFEDVIEKTRGLFDGTQAGLEPGLANMESVDSDVTPDGAVYQFRCQGCGNTVQLVVEYPELVALKFKLSPHIAFQGPAARLCPQASKWLPQHGKWKLQQPCGACSWNLRLELQKNEPEGMLRRARREDYFGGQHEKALSEHCNAIYQRMRSAGRPRGY